MEKLVFVFIVAAIAFWLGRQTKRCPSQPHDTFANSAIRSRINMSESDTARIPMNGQRALALIFISGWIIAWSVGIILVAKMFLFSLGAGIITVFIGGWLLAATAGWLFAARAIYKLATGKPVRSNGEQI